MAVQVQKFFHPNGTLRTEIHLRDGRPHGVRRAWHPNGVLAAEVPCEYGRQHGVSKFWNEKGEFLGQFELRYGTGVVKMWFDNGRLKSECHMKEGNPHGRLRGWDENGDLITEGFWCDARHVSKKKYVELCAKDETLPRYEELSVTGAKEIKRRHRGERIPKKAECEQHGRSVEKLLASENHEALEWLKGSPPNVVRTVGPVSTTEGSITLIEEAYSAGARRVFVVELSPATDGRQSTDKLLVMMPEKIEDRERVLAWSNELAEDDGYSPDADWGQEYLIVWFD